MPLVRMVRRANVLGCKMKLETYDAYEELGLEYRLGKTIEYRQRTGEKHRDGVIPSLSGSRAARMVSD